MSFINGKDHSGSIVGEDGRLHIDGVQYITSAHPPTIKDIYGAPTLEGQRHEQLKRLMGRLSTIMDEQGAVDAALSWNNQHCSPPENVKVVEQQARDMYRRFSTGQEKTVDEEEKRARGDRYNLPLAPAHTIEHKTAQELVDSDIPDVQVFLDGLCPYPALLEVAGETKAGKSFLALNACLAVAYNLPTFLGQALHVHGNVIYLNTEMNPRTIKRRLKSMMVGLPPSEFKVIIPMEKVKVDNSGILSVLELCKQYNPVMIVVDCHYMATTKNTKASEEMHEVIQNYVLLRDTFNCALWIVHHTNKGAGGRLSGTDEGSGAVTLAQSCDAILQLKKSQVEKETRLLISTGQRDFEDDWTHAIQLNSETKWFEDKGETTEVEHMEQSKKSTAREPKITVDAVIAVLRTFRHESAPRQALVAAVEKSSGQKQRSAYKAVERAIESGVLAVNKFGTVTLMERVAPAPESESKAPEGDPEA